MKGISAILCYFTVFVGICFSGPINGKMPREHVMPINSQNYVPQEEIGFTQGKIVFNMQNKCILIGCALLDKIS